MINLANLNEIKKDLQRLLSKERYEHSLLVADAAKNLATVYNLDVDKAYLAGLLHDIAKEFSSQENEKWLQKYNLNPALLLPENKKIIHADIGAVYVAEDYHFDADICDAIKYHTIGHENMSDFAKIVFIADKIGRQNITNELQEIKKVAYQDLNKALYLCLKRTEKKLAIKNLKLHPDTMKLLKKLEKLA